LRPGMQIAQFVFSMLTSPVDSNYKNVGRFHKNNWEHFKTAKPRVVKKKK